MNHIPSTLTALALASSLASADLVGHWRFEEGTGTSAADSSAASRSGLLNDAIWNSTGLAPVPSGSSSHLEFNGSTSSVAIAGFKGVTGTNDRTVAAWIRTNDPVVNRSIVSWGTNLGGQKWTFRTQSDNGTAGALRIEVNGGYLVGSTVVTDGEWHHVAVTWANDGTPDVTDAKLYVDGVLDADLSTPGASPSANQSQSINTASDADVLIGDDFQTTRQWSGGIDDLRIYDEALDADAISLLAIGDPLINSFETSAEIVGSGGPVTLSWDTDPGNDTLTIDNGVGDVRNLDMITVNPTVDTTYTLSATRGVVSSERRVTVLVENPPQVNTLEIFGPITLILGESTTLFWDVIGEVSLDLNGRDVSGLSEIEVKPTVTTTYLLSAANAFGTTTREVTVTVVDPNAPTLEWAAAGQTEGALPTWLPAINSTFNTTLAWGNGTTATVQTGTSNFPPVTTWVNGADYNLTGTPGTSWHTGLSDAITKQDVSWELVFRPGDFTGTHTLFNTGGNGFGTGIVLDGSTVDFRVQSADASNQRVIVATDLAALGTASEFYHLVATVDLDPTLPAVVSLYLNGTLVAGPTSSGSAIPDWDGSDVAELGRGSNIPTSTAFPWVPFTGDVASFAYFENKVLDAAGVESRYKRLSGEGDEFTITDITWNAQSGELSLTFASVAGRNYRLETTDNLADVTWLEVDDAISATGEETTVILSNFYVPAPENPKQFFRVSPGAN